MSPRIENVSLTGSRLWFVMENGDELELELEGDCCSQSFFDEDTRLDVKDVLGQRIQSIEAVPGEVDDDGSYTVTKHHFLILRTDQQSLSLAWRNESNGYYDGSIRVKLNGNEVASYVYSTWHYPEAA